MENEEVFWVFFGKITLGAYRIFRRLLKNRTKQKMYTPALPFPVNVFLPPFEKFFWIDFFAKKINSKKLFKGGQKDIPLHLHPLYLWLAVAEPKFLEYL